MRALLLAALFLTSVAIGAEGNKLVSATEVRIVGNRIEFRGLITEESSAAVLEIYAASEIKPTILWIESNGGAARAAIKLGALAFERHLDVEVDTFCHSACANYVFPAGARKTLSRNASLVWHGGATQPVTDREIEKLLDDTLSNMDREARAQLLEGSPRGELLDRMHRSLDEIIDLETRFFERIGVDQRITTLGFFVQPPPLTEGWYIGWDYSLEDLAILGVHDLSIKEGNGWVPESPWKSTHIYRVDLRNVSGFRPKSACSSG